MIAEFLGINFSVNVPCAKVYIPPYRCGTDECEASFVKQHRPGRGVVESVSGSNLTLSLQPPFFVPERPMVCNTTLFAREPSHILLEISVLACCSSLG